MAAKYDFRPNPNPKGDDEQQPLHPRIVRSGTKNMDDIVHEISQFSGSSPGDVLSVLTNLENYCIRHLSNGYNVKLGNIGTFSVSLSSRKVMDKKEIRSSSVSFSNVNFKVTPDFMKSIRGTGHLERAEYGFDTSSKKYSKEERLVLLTDYLKTHPFITRQEYGELTGLLRDKAARELRELSGKGLIRRNGRVPHVVYSAVETGE